jgi:hypothetical protein
VNLQQYYERCGGAEAMNALAERLETSPMYLYQLRTQYPDKSGQPRRPSIEMALKMCKASNYQLTLKGLLGLDNVSDVYWLGRARAKVRKAA